MRSGLDVGTARRYSIRSTVPGALTGPLNWYRALPLDRKSPPGSVTVPTLFLWGDRESFVTRVAAEECGNHVTGPYRFEVLAGASHWLPTTASSTIAPLLLEHLASVGA